jgi:hypothetical protein
MAERQEKLADRVTRLSAELKEAREEMGRCNHEFSKPYQATRPAWDAVFDGYEPHGSDPEPKYHYVEKKEYGWERRCVRCGLTQYTTESKPIIAGHEPVF